MTVQQEQVEDHESFLRSIQGVVDSLREQTFALLTLVNEQHATSEAEGSKAVSTPEILKGRRAINEQVAILRHHNRHLAFLVRDTKAITGRYRAEVDRLHLSLQNLYYEQHHLEGEITGCEEYPHAYAQLPLFTEEDFLARYPEWNERRLVEEEDNGEQGLMKARILEEKREREELEARRLELVKQKAELVKENLKRKDDLGNLDKQLETFVEAAKPIQHIFEKEY
ncbi:MAG: hypothetical protein Q9162_005270 [Coniocarpon cinnabarinum]